MHALNGPGIEVDKQARTVCLAEVIEDRSLVPPRVGRPLPPLIGIQEFDDDPAQRALHVGDSLRRVSGLPDGLEPRLVGSVSVWSARPAPNSPEGEAWEDGARQGWEWAQSGSGAYAMSSRRKAEKARDWPPCSTNWTILMLAGINPANKMAPVRWLPGPSTHFTERIHIPSGHPREMPSYKI
jgi:hypothetical protein